MMLYDSLWVPIEKPPEQQLLPPCSGLVRSNFPGDLRQLPVQNGFAMNRCQFHEPSQAHHKIF